MPELDHLAGVQGRVVMDGSKAALAVVEQAAVDFLVRGIAEGQLQSAFAAVTPFGAAIGVADDRSGWPAGFRKATRSVAFQIGPHAEALRNGPFKDGLLTACREIGHRRRILVRPVWIDSTLRQEAAAKKLDLRPTPSGVLAVFFEGDRELDSTPIDLSSDPVNIGRKVAWRVGQSRCNRRGGD